VSVPEQDSPVLALAVTDPVGPTPAPATKKLIVTACAMTEGLGVFEEIVVVLAILVAEVFCVLDVDEYFEVAAHVAVSVQVPVPLDIVT
jgi:hypothetical protein